MALSGIQIYKLLPQTNCKECGFPTCLAFAMKLAAKQVELSACPYVTDEAKSQLAESAAPPIRLVSIKAENSEVKAGNEVVLFRHEKTYYNKPGIFIKIRSSEGEAAIKDKVSKKATINFKNSNYYVAVGTENLSNNKSSKVHISDLGDKLLIFEYKKDGILLGEAI